MSTFDPILFLPFKPDTDIGLFALRPLLIAGMVRPVVDGDGGINRHVVNDYPAGVLCAIDPYTGMQVGDKHDIYWGTLKIFQKDVLPGELNRRLFFYLPKAPIVPGWVETVYYQLTRNGSTIPDEPSVALRLLVKLDEPGGDDKEPHLPGHSQLKPVVLPDDVVQNGVDAKWAEDGVPVTVPVYPGIRGRDVILVYWGTVLLPLHIVTQRQAEGLDPIIAIADQAAILAAGNSQALVVEYEPRDEVWNWCQKRSLRTTVRVGAGELLLEQPIIKESVRGEIDLVKLGKADVTVQIHVRTEEFDKGDTVLMKWISRPPRSDVVIHHSKPTEIDNIPSILELMVPNAIARAAAQGWADVSYVLTKANGNRPLLSRRTFADVVGEVSLLPAPTIRQAIGDTLEPDESMATVDIGPSDLIKGGDFIVLVWLGTTSSGGIYLHQPSRLVSDGEEGKTITLEVEAEHIELLRNGKLDLSYRVSNDSSGIYGVSVSEHAFFNVQPIRADLPAPKVVEADPPDVLDPSKVFDVAHVLVDYLGTVKGDELTYYWSGNPLNGSTSDWIPITTVIAGKPVRFRVDSEFVTANINRFVKVRYTLKRAATGKYSYSTTLNLLVGELVGDLPEPVVLQAPDGALNPMNALNGVDVKVSYTSMKPLLDTITLRWLGTPGPGTSDDLEQPGHASGSVQFHLPASVVGANIDKTVTVDYTVLRYGITTPSDSLSLKVLAFQNPEKELPQPQVPQANDQNVLDLTTFAGNAAVTVKAWPFSAAKQRAWLRLEGRTGSGDPYSIELLKGDEISPAQATNGLDEPLLRTDLMKLGHASSATVVCKITFDGSPEEYSAVDFPSLPLTIRTRYEYLTPVISIVRDSRGEILDGGTTYDTQVTLRGTATRDQKVEIFDGSTPKGQANVGADGVWTHSLSGLSVKTYSLTAKALYGAEPVSAPPRTFTVAEAKTPTISSVIDSQGQVAPGGTTYDRAVTLDGKANANQKVEIFDGLTSKGSADVNNSGDWTLFLSGLTVKSYSLTAKALYGTEPESAPPRTFTVAAHVAPTITSVRDSRGEVSNGGVTTDTSVALQGRVTPLRQVQIYDAGFPKHIVDASSRGDWSTSLEVAVGSRILTARSISTGQDSNTRSFRVDSPLPPLVFNTSPVTLSGRIYLFPAYPAVLPAFGAGTSVRHQASGGKPGYTYRSSNTAVAVVDNAGLVTVRGRGQTSITASDSENQSKSYTVTVTGVIHCVYLGVGSYSAMANAASNEGGRLPSFNELREIYSAYGSRWPMVDNFYWSTDVAATFPFLRYYSKSMKAGHEGHQKAILNSYGVGLK